jgi:CubicO group peptidase (beta-lactamase class C family)
MQTEGARGVVEPGFKGVREAFEAARAVDRRGGAALSVVQDGRVVVELVTGSGADDATARTPETTQVCFSCTKGMVATALLLLIERGLLDLDEPVSRYWPEFGQHGKGDLLVRHVVSHTSGQPAFRALVSPEDLTDDELTEAVVASDASWWPPGTEIAYQALTYGPLTGGLVRRVSGMSVGSFVQNEIAGPLGLDLWIGLPEARERDVAPLLLVPGDEQAVPGEHPAHHAQLENPRTLLGPGVSMWNTRAYHAAEIPGASGVATATALARMYGCLALGGTLDGYRLLRPETVELGRTPIASGTDLFGGQAQSFGVGFMLPCDGANLGSDPRAFGHSGYGGQEAGALPSHRLGFAYLTTAMRGGDAADERVAMIVGALDEAITDAS